MSLEDITLPTNKSETRVSNNRRTIRSGEKGLSIKVTLVDANDQPYDLSAFTLEFNEIKDQGKIVFDSGSGDNSGSFNVVDAKGGVFTYTLAPQVYSASGRAWFVIKQDDTIIDTTKDFYFDVLQDATIHIDNDNYVSSMEAELDAFKAMTQKEQQNADALIKSLTDQMNEAIADGNTKEADALADAKSKLQALQDATGKLNDDWTAELNTQKQNFTTLQSQWDSELQSIQAKANTDTDSAVKAINDRYTNDFAKLQSDFTNWQTSTTQNYQKQVDAILAKVQQEGTEVANVQKQVDDTATKMQTLTKQFSNIDFTQFLKPSALDNYYTKTEVDSKLSTAGAVKTVDKIQPDNSGNVDLQSVMGQKITFVKCDSPQAAADASSKPAADGSIVLGIYDMNDEPSQAVVGDQKIDIEWLYNHLNDLQTQVSGLSNLQSLIEGKADSATVYTKSELDSKLADKADKSDVTNLQQNVTAQEAEIADLKKNNLKMVACTQAEYDALQDKDPYTLYMIGG